MTKDELQERVEELEAQVEELEGELAEAEDQASDWENQYYEVEEKLDERYQEGRDEGYASGIEDATRAVENLA